MSALSEGSEFAGYRIEAILGRGGMGIVYRAVEVDLTRPVALKVVAPELAEDEGFRTRFTHEARVAASIDHPNVIPIYDAGEEEGTLYLAMRLVDGVDLGALIKSEKRLEPARAVRVVDQMAEALDAAHGRGLVHRDVKPANALVTRSRGREHVYLTDFGLTKETGSDAGLTRTGQWVGTLDFVAPEQMKGEDVDGRADIYALGCVLYQALTGSIPFDRPSDAAKMFAHLSEDPPKLRDRVPGLPESLEPVLAKALAKSPDERYQSAGELGDAAQAALGGDRVVSPAPGAAPTVTAPAPGPARTPSPPPATPPIETAGSARPTDPLPPGAAPRSGGDGRGGRTSGAMIAALVAGVIAVGAIAALAVTQLGGSDSKSSPPTPVVDNGGNSGDNGNNSNKNNPNNGPNNGNNTSNQQSAPHVTNADVRRVLDEYQTAYSNQDTSALASLFSPNLVRRNGNDPAQNLQEALGTYAGQFAQLDHPTYRLFDVRASGGRGQGSASATYTISDNGAPGVSGGISFHFVVKGDLLLIDNIVIQPF